MLKITPFTSFTPCTPFTLLAANKQQYVHQCEKIHAGPDLEHGFHEDVQDHDEDEGLVKDIALAYADDERVQAVGQQDDNAGNAGGEQRLQVLVVGVEMVTDEIGVVLLDGVDVKFVCGIAGAHAPGQVFLANFQG